MPAPRFRHTFESAALALSLLACSAPTPSEAPSTPVPAATAAPLTATTHSAPLALPSPTPRAGVLKGDGVLALDDQPVRNPPELQRRLPRSVGQMGRLSVRRRGGRL